MTDRIRGGFSGHNRITTQALTSIARAVAGEAFDISPRQVRADWTDDSGLLALVLAVPIAVPSLNRVGREPSVVERFGGTIWHRATVAKPFILHRVMALTGSSLSRVDIRITGVRVVDGGRVV